MGLAVNPPGFSHCLALLSTAEAAAFHNVENVAHLVDAYAGKEKIGCSMRRSHIPPGIKTNAMWSRLLNRRATSEPAPHRTSPKGVGGAVQGPLACRGPCTPQDHLIDALNPRHSLNQQKQKNNTHASDPMMRRRRMGEANAATLPRHPHDTAATHGPLPRAEGWLRLRRHQAPLRQHVC